MPTDIRLLLAAAVTGRKVRGNLLRRTHLLPRRLSHPSSRAMGASDLNRQFVDSSNKMVRLLNGGSESLLGLDCRGSQSGNITTLRLLSHHSCSSLEHICFGAQVLCHQPLSLSPLTVVLNAVQCIRFLESTLWNHGVLGYARYTANEKTWIHMGVTLKISSQIQNGIQCDYTLPNFPMRFWMRFLLRDGRRSRGFPPPFGLDRTSLSSCLDQGKMPAEMEA